MKIDFNEDKTICRVADGAYYEFIEYHGRLPISSCHKCAFYARPDAFSFNLACLLVPCQKGVRRDKKDGFWRLRIVADNQQLTK